MTPEAQRIAIAEACGWTDVHWNGVYSDLRGKKPGSDRNTFGIPDFLNDLNAMAEAESSIPQPSDFYRFNLIEVCGIEQRIHLATAAQRAEALLRTLNLWRP